MVDLMASMRSMEATQRAITTIDTTLGQTASQVGGLPG
jgi:flagellar basal body rod protein FlgG